MSLLYFSNPSTPEIRDAMLAGQFAGLFGAITRPGQGNKMGAFPVWIADNGCGPGKKELAEGYPGDGPFTDWLAMLRPSAGRCKFAAAPDVLGDAAATVERSRPFFPVLNGLGYRAAFVGQNGLTPGMVPWSEFGALFLGGVPECVPCGYVRPWQLRKQHHCPYCGRRLSEWKLGAAARQLAEIALGKGMWLHMGRVNSLRRMRYARALGCHSADGTFVKHAPDRNLPEALGWLRDTNFQSRLWEAEIV